MKKRILSLLSVATTLAIADNYVILVDQEDSNYEISVNYTPTGQITCSTNTPLVADVYKDQSFIQNQSNCTEKYTGSDGSQKQISVEDRTENLSGSLLLNSCKDILNDGHSIGDGLYPISYNALETVVECDMTTNGGGWTQFWWHEINSTTFTPNENDMLGHAFGTFNADQSNYGYQRLPTSLSKTSTELLAVDGTSNVFKWDFSNSSNTSTAVWNAFANHKKTEAGVAKNGGLFNPVVLSGSRTTYDQDSFMYREQSGMTGFILDDDNCDCQTTLNAGAPMCGTTWSNSYGDGIMEFGVDSLNDKGCSTPEPERSLKLYFR